MSESSIFQAAVKLPATARAAFLAQACGSNAALRLEVEALLSAHEQPGAFMHRPAIADATTTFGPGPERPGMRIGPYKLLQFLGEGGMGTVFLAEQTEPVRRMVALKIIKPGMDSSQVLARFEAERQALAVMDHPNIAKVFEAGTTGLQNEECGLQNEKTPPANLQSAISNQQSAGRPYFVMELVKGVSITEFCDKNKLTTRQRLELFIPVCLAIQHAHMKGIIHRDIKPSNVLIALYDGKPVPKVIDFGVAKAMAEPLTRRTLFTQIGQIVGTFEYMSPEQATLNQLDVDTRSDIYSLGVLLYELLTGSTPLDKDRLRTLALDQMLRAIREEEPLRPSARLSSSPGALAMAAAYRGGDSRELAGQLRGELDWIVMKCLEKERDRRFVTAGSLAQDIQRYLNDEPVEACPPSLSYRFSKAMRKYKKPVAVAGVMLLLLVASVVASTWQAIRATRAEDRALAAQGLAQAAEEAAVKDRDKTKAALDQVQRVSDDLQRVNRDLKLAEYENWRALFHTRVASMQSAWHADDIVRVRELLEATLSKKDDPDERGFEWHYWNRQAHQELSSLKINDGNRVEAVDISANGKYLAAAVRDLTKSKTAPDGDFDPEILRQPTHRTWKVFVWDIAAGKMHTTFSVSREYPPYASAQTQLAFSPDGSRLAFGCWARILGIGGARSKGKDSPPFDRNQWGDLVVWDVGTGKELYFEESEKTKNTGPLTRQLFVFNRTGSHMLLQQAGVFQQVGPAPRLLDLATKRQTKIAGIGPASCPRFDPAGKRLAFLHTEYETVRADPDALGAPGPKAGRRRIKSRAVKVWDLESDQELLAIPLAAVNDKNGDANFVSVTCLEFSPQGDRLAMMSSVGVIKIWDLKANKELSRFGTARTNVFGGGGMGGGRPGLGGLGGQMSFSPDGTCLAEVFRDRAINVWDAVTGENRRSFKAHDGNTGKIAFMPDGKRLYSFGNGMVKVWDATGVDHFTGNELEWERVRVGSRFGLPFAVDELGPGIPRNGSIMTAVSPDGTRVVRCRQGSELTKDPDTLRIVYKVNFTELKIFDGARREILTVPADMHREFLLGLQFSPDGRHVASWDSKELKLWRSGTGEVVYQIAIAGRLLCRFSPDGTRLVTIDCKIPNPGKGGPGGGGGGSRMSSGPVVVHDLAAGKEILTLSEDASDVVVSHDGRFLATFPQYVFFGGGSAAPAKQGPRLVKLWDTKSGEELLALPASVSALLFTPDGKRLITDEFKVLNVRDVATGNVLQTIPVRALSQMALSPDGNRIAITTSVPGATQLWDLATGKEVCTLQGHTGYIQAVAFSPPDGRRLATCAVSRLGERLEVKVWDAATGRELLDLSHVSAANRLFPGAASFGLLSFSSDGHRLIYQTGTGVVEIWDASPLNR